jgi:hypothetical protein
MQRDRPSDGLGRCERNAPSERGAPSDLLRPFVDVEPSELVTALLLTANAFLLLTAYYFLKVAREPLILLGGGGEVKSDAAVAQSVILVFATSAYSWIADRLLFVGPFDLMLLAAGVRSSRDPLPRISHGLHDRQRGLAA